MKISWLGHACFLIETASKTTIITDPYQPGAFSGAVKYLPIGETADIVTISHHHADHDFTEGLTSATIIDKEGVFTVKDVKVEGIGSFHDSSLGSQRGKNIIFIIETEGLRIVHFGDVGTLDLDFDRLKNIDVAMVPVGGVFTINHKDATVLLKKLQPKIFIPMHFKTHKLEFNIDGVDKFLEDKSDIERQKSLVISRDSLGDQTKIVVLEHLR